MGVVSECCCKEVYYRYPHNNYYFPLLHLYSSFFGSIIPISLFIFKCFFILVYLSFKLGYTVSIKSDQRVFNLEIIGCSILGYNLITISGQVYGRVDQLPLFKAEHSLSTRRSQTVFKWGFKMWNP